MILKTFRKKVPVTCRTQILVMQQTDLFLEVMEEDNLSGITYNINSFRPGQNGRHFANKYFRCIFCEWKVFYFIKISLKFVAKGPINNNLVLV